METIELVRELREYFNQARPVTNNSSIILRAANKLEELQRIIDDMTNDHYVDYLDFYTNRCRELEEKMSEILHIISDKNENSNWEE